MPRAKTGKGYLRQCEAIKSNTRKAQEKSVFYKTPKASQVPTLPKLSAPTLDEIEAKYGELRNDRVGN